VPSRRFICHVTMKPEARDEIIKRFMENGVPEVPGVKLKGMWISLLRGIGQDGGRRAAVRALDDLNAPDLVPAADFDQLKKFLEAKG